MYREPRFAGEWSIGDTLAYPLSDGPWSRICNVPPSIYKQWVEEAVPPNTDMGCGVIGGVNGAGWRLMNKMAIVVDCKNMDGYRPLAIYAHDHAYYLIEKVE